MGISRLSGAALYAKVTAQCRTMLAEDYGLPMDGYAAENLEPYYMGGNMLPVLAVRFTRKSNGRQIIIDNIFPSDNGELDQYSAPEMR